MKEICGTFHCFQKKLDRKIRENWEEMQKLGLGGLPRFINSNTIERIGVKVGFYDFYSFLNIRKKLIQGFHVTQAYSCNLRKPLYL